MINNSVLTNLSLMNKLFRVSFATLALCSAVVLNSCNDEDPPLPDNIVKFQSDAQGLGANDTQVTVNIQLDRAVDATGNLTVSFATTGVTYGTDFTTDPAAVDGKISIPVAVGTTQASFKVTKTNTNGLDGTEKVVFTIDEVAEGLVLGTAKTFTLSFSEIIATNSEMQIDGGGTNAQNRVFIDLSGNSQLAVARSTWDLAFATGADEWRVVLNSSNKMLAYKLDKSNLIDVTADDTLGLGLKFSTEAIFGTVANLEEGQDLPDWVAGSLAWMDDRSGDLTKTAIAEVSDEDGDNNVYIINRGTDADGNELGWLKVRVLQDGGSYAIQYGEINSGTFNTKTVTKNTAYNFTYFSFVSGAEVDVEPAKEDWDIAWTGFTNITTFDGITFFPYYNQDIILTNIHGGAKAFAYTTGTVGDPGVTGDKTYDTFTEADLSVITNYSTSQLGIGSGWRTLGQTSSSLNTTRFYIVEDAAGNIYKLQFTALVDSNNQRGKPSFRFELLTKGS